MTRNDADANDVIWENSGEITDLQILFFFSSGHAESTPSLTITRVTQENGHVSHVQILSLSPLADRGLDDRKEERDAEQAAIRLVQICNSFLFTRRHVAGYVQFAVRNFR